jgi:hypothetical protein
MRGESTQALSGLEMQCVQSISARPRSGCLYFMHEHETTKTSLTGTCRFSASSPPPIIPDPPFLTLFTTEKEVDLIKAFLSILHCP